jgi:hypothetical protein
VSSDVAVVTWIATMAGWQPWSLLCKVLENRLSPRTREVWNASCGMRVGENVQVCHSSTWMLENKLILEITECKMRFAGCECGRMCRCVIPPRRCWKID